MEKKKIAPKKKKRKQWCRGRRNHRRLGGRGRGTRTGAGTAGECPSHTLKSADSKPRIKA